MIKHFFVIYIYVEYIYHSISMKTFNPASLYEEVIDLFQAEKLPYPATL